MASGQEQQSLTSLPVKLERPEEVLESSEPEGDLRNCGKGFAELGCVTCTTASHTAWEVGHPDLLNQRVQHRNEDSLRPNSICKEPPGLQRALLPQMTSNDLESLSDLEKLQLPSEPQLGPMMAESCGDHPSAPSSIQRDSELTLMDFVPAGEQDGAFAVWNESVISERVPPHHGLYSEPQDKDEAQPEDVCDRAASFTHRVRRGNTTATTDTSMTACAPFQHLTTSNNCPVRERTDTLASTAVKEISKLVDDGFAILHLEISRSQEENEALKCKLQMMELQMARCYAEDSGLRERLAMCRCSGVQSDENLLKPANVFAERYKMLKIDSELQPGPENSPTPDIRAEVSYPDISSGAGRSVAAASVPCTDMEEGSTELVLIKEEGVEENDTQGEMNSREKRSVDWRAASREKRPVQETQNKAANHTEDLTEQHRTRRAVWEVSGPEKQSLTSLPVKQEKAEDVLRNTEPKGGLANSRKGFVDSGCVGVHPAPSLVSETTCQVWECAQSKIAHRENQRVQHRDQDSLEPGPIRQEPPGPQRALLPQMTSNDLESFLDLEKLPGPSEPQLGPMMAEGSGDNPSAPSCIQRDSELTLMDFVPAGEQDGAFAVWNDAVISERVPPHHGLYSEPQDKDEAQPEDVCDRAASFTHRLAYILDALANKALAEICKVVDDGYAVLRFEVSRHQKENEVLKRKLQIALESTQSSAEITRTRIADEVQVCHAFRGPTDECGFAASEGTLCQKVDISRRGDCEIPDFNDDAQAHAMVTKEEAQPEVFIIKEERPEDDRVTRESIPAEIFPPGSLEWRAGGREKCPIQETQNKAANHTEELTEQHRTRRAVWEVSGLDSDLKAEGHSEHVEMLQRRGTEHRAEALSSPDSELAMFERSGQLGSYCMQGGAIIETEDPCCSYSTETGPQSQLVSFSEAQESSGCDVDFAASEGVQNHVDESEGRKTIVCRYCGRGFARKNALEIHQRVHTGEKPFRCVQCGKQFAHSGNLKVHQSVHTGERRFRCSLCGKRFISSSHLKRHWIVHTRDRPFCCPQCGKRFSDSGSCKRHQSVHGGKRVFVCSLCFQDFTSPAHLKRHRLQMHRSDGSNDSESGTGESAWLQEKDVLL
ncbi:hypothetical protein GJAV_G00248770 [Gymnothorax javanicus]|nr:hypothetical protein GJAV_G00248770 [Gymnothorax javanicus]